MSQPVFESCRVDFDPFSHGNEFTQNLINDIGIGLICIETVAVRTVADNIIEMTVYIEVGIGVQVFQNGFEVLAVSSFFGASFIVFRVIGIDSVNNVGGTDDKIKRMSGKDAGFLRTLGIDMVSVANNHVFDYGEQGFLDTLDALHAEGIPYSGGGRNLTEASAVRYVVTGGRKIAIVSATEIERFYHFTQKAQKEKPGVLKTQQEEVWKKELKRAKKNSDYVIAYVHWGTEGKIHYGQDQTEIADLCVKAGADAVIGGHPHRLQGIEFIKNVPVAYSVGNFWFSTGKLYTTIAQIQIDDSGSLKLRMIPCIQDSLTTSILTEKKQIKAFYHYLADISNHVGIDEDGFFYPYKNVEKPGVSPYAYTSGRRYGQYFDDVDLDLKSIDIVGNLQ